MAALAALLDGQGKYDEAEKLYRRALAVFERTYGPEHYEVAVNLNNLAALCHATGRTEEAERLYRRALSVKEKLLGTKHIDVALTLNNLAVFYNAAETFGSRTLLPPRLAIFEDTLDPSHPSSRLPGELRPC